MGNKLEISIPGPEMLWNYSKRDSSFKVVKHWIEEHIPDFFDVATIRKSHHQIMIMIEDTGFKKVFQINEHGQNTFELDISEFQQAYDRALDWQAKLFD